VNDVPSPQLSLVPTNGVSLIHELVVFLDALVQRFDFFEQRLQNIPQLGAQCSATM